MSEFDQEASLTLSLIYPIWAQISYHLNSPNPFNFQFFPPCCHCHFQKVHRMSPQPSMTSHTLILMFKIVQNIVPSHLLYCFYLPCRHPKIKTNCTFFFLNTWTYWVILLLVSTWNDSLPPTSCRWNPTYSSRFIFLSSPITSWTNPPLNHSTSIPKHFLMLINIFNILCWVLDFVCLFSGFCFSWVSYICKFTHWIVSTSKQKLGFIHL